MSLSSNPQATFVIPCLNEAKTLGSLISECQDAFSKDPETSWSVLVADNGSTDGSIEIARKAGVEVVNVPVRGYGAALNAGIRHATSDWVCYADADGTYCPSDAVQLVRAARARNAELVLGSRLRGRIHDGAMPWTHRYLGTPVLSFLIRFLYGIEISDCNSGIRCVRKDAFLKWDIRDTGMEFASALLIRAASHGAQIVETPATLRPNPPGRVPHLRSWRDGMRHLLVVLAAAPWFFWYLGIALLLLSFAIAIPCFWGPITFGEVGLFGPHTLAIATVIGFFGALSFSMSLLMYSTGTRRRPPPALAERLVNVSEDTLFWSLVAFGLIFVVGALYLLAKWYFAQFGTLDYVKHALFTVYLTVIPVTLVVGIFQAHLGKRFTSPR